MEKYLVEIRIPAADAAFDAWLPAALTVGQAVALAGAMAVKLGLPPVGADALLCRAGDGAAYPADALVERTDIRSGARLILM